MPSILIKVLWEMDAMAPFRIPVSSLKADEAQYEWDLDSDFLRLFDDLHETEKGKFSVRLNLQRTGSLTTMEFRISGSVNTTCDRCTVPIEMPLEGNYEVIVKFGDPSQSTDEVIFIDPEANGLNAGQLIYDFILLSIPISRRIPGCESLPEPPCDMAVLSYLSEQKDDSPGGDNPLWGDLRKVIDN